MKIKSGNMRWIVGGALIAAAIVGLSFLKLGDSLVYFYTPSEAQAKAAELQGKTIKLGGMVQKGSVKWNGESLELTFLVTDMAGHDVQTSYHGTPPDLFKEGQGVVADGQLSSDGKSMRAHKLMVKHSEEYKKPDAAGATDAHLLEKSLFREQAR